MECENKYEKGKIYKIVDNTNGDIYIGSTIKTLQKRLIAHKADYNSWLNGNDTSYYTSFEILKNNDYHIELLEDYPCNSKKELEKKETEYIKNNNCLNMKLPVRSLAEYYEDNKERLKEEHRNYKLNNKQKVDEYNKNYREKNKIQVEERSKKHYEENKEKIIMRSRKFYEENKDIIHQKQKIYREKNKLYEKITCECGAIVSKGYLTEHKKTKKHINYINSL